ncbi:alpha/beta hydrolase fold domain-containing protein [Ligilactobacillus acidipiscis]|uniref:alpha/beta hydrolase fold domain-containing protein n=1 Tax=Ligilactobacillus acidipiscis TaxID=89059 RepID=UPI0022E4C2BC|nr:alpha/beta hydrolase [Ligilactobacillus acidipiscis]
MIFHNEASSKADQEVISKIAQQTAKGPSLMEANPQSRALYDETIASGTSSQYNVKVEKESIGGVNGLLITTNSARDNVILLYIHGGGYIVGSASGYKNYVAKLVVQTNVNAFIPNYSLAPESVFPKANNQLIDVYNELKKAYRDIIILGDSAGGGLALTLTNQVLDKPLATVAMSPWTDVSMSNLSIKKNKEKDFLLGPVAGPEIGKKYSGLTDPTNSKISPLFSKTDNTVPTLIHVGTSEILLDDSLEYAKKFSNINTFIWKDMFHVFPLFEQLESSKIANQLTCDFILAHVQK